MDLYNKIQIYKTQNEMVEAAGRLILKVAKNAVDVNGQFVISLSGGQTPQLLYCLLSKPPYSNEMPWGKTFVFWGDERCVPQNDAQNNAYMAKTLLLDHIEIPPNNIYPIPVNLPPAAAAKEYEQTIKSFFKEAAPVLDLILLGLGENGHTASLFPGNEVIYEKKHLVKEVYIPEQRISRITMMPDLINQSKYIIFLVDGENKAKILKDVLTTTYQPSKLPAQMIKPVNGDLYWFLDTKAASLLID